MPEASWLDTYHFYEQEWRDLEELREAFEWELPDEFNIATYACDRWADDKGRVAFFEERSDGGTTTYTFWQLRNLTNQLANYLESVGVERGDRVAVNTSQRPETVMAHLATWKVGAVSVPMSTLFGTEGLRYRLEDSGASVAFVDQANVDTLRAIDVDSLDTVVTVGDVLPVADEHGFEDVVTDRSREYAVASTAPGDTACIFYTSGTTGNPKGVVHRHQLLLGNVPLYVVSVVNMAVEPGDVLWTPMEWAWIGTLPSYVLPMLFYGRPVLAYDGGRFEPATAFELIEKYGVSISLLPPTALRKMRSSGVAHDYDQRSMRVVSSGGETLGSNLRDWVKEAFSGSAINEVYGQTEADGLVGECEALFESREESMGKALPGHDLAILDPETREELDPGDVGEIAVRYEGNPVCFREYLGLPTETDQKVQDGWLLTEDLGRVDADGYFEFVGRKDDVIISSGYRIGPEEIEDTLASHEAVVDAGVVGIPDDERGEVPKAFVVLADGYAASDDLRSDLQSYVKDRLAAYESPSELAFVDELPRTSTGKLQRVHLRDRHEE